MPKDLLIEQITDVVQVAIERDKGLTLGEFVPNLAMMKPDPGMECLFDHSGITVRAFESSAYALLECLERLIEDDSYASMELRDFMDEEVVTLTVIIKDGVKFYDFGNIDGHVLSLETILEALDVIAEDEYLECRDSEWALSWEHDTPGFMAEGKRHGHEWSSFGLGSNSIH